MLYKKYHRNYVKQFKRGYKFSRCSIPGSYMTSGNPYIKDRSVVVNIFGGYHIRVIVNSRGRLVKEISRC